MTTERMLDQEERAAGVASLAKRLRAIAGPETPLRSYVADLMREAADALEAVERERDRAEEALRGIVFKCSDVVNAARWSVGNGGGHVCDFRAAVQSCHDPAAKIVGRQHLSDARRIPGLGARTPEGCADGE